MRRGFTLVELLIVITTLAVLLALLTPTLEWAVHHPQLAVCGGERDAVVNGPPAEGSAAPAGRQYGAERTPITIDGHPGFILHPLKPAADGSRPWVWYAPTRAGALPDAGNEWLLRRLLDRGIAVCGVDVGESYGNPPGRKVYSEFYEYIVKTYSLDPKPRLLPQSRGGLMLYNWAAENPDKVRCIGAIFPVCDLRSFPGLERAAPAYGMTAEELARQLAAHNPVDRLEPLAKARIPILHIHGDTDAVVPLEANSRALYNRYAALGGKMSLVVVPGKGHEVVPEFFESPELLMFLIRGGEEGAGDAPLAE